jgi:hypothetical protein
MDKIVAHVKGSVEAEIGHVLHAIGEGNLISPFTMLRLQGMSKWITTANDLKRYMSPLLIA